MADGSVTSKAIAKKIKKACRLCGKNRNLTKTECCDNWICEDKYNRRYGDYGCQRDHRRYSCCYFHHNEKHEGKWQDCKKCMDLGASEYDFSEELKCVNCGFESQTTEDFAFQLNDDFYCTKEECQAKCKTPPCKNSKRKSEESKKEIKKKSKVVPKKVKRACRSCGRTSKLIKTKCCNNWICNDAKNYVPFSYLSSCHRNHHRYSSCTFHHNESHPGKWRDCEECKELDCAVEPEYEEVTCVSCNLKSDSMDDFAFQVENDFYCKKEECQAKCKPPPSSRPKKKVEDPNSVVIKKIKKACRLCGKNRKLTLTECCNNWICDDEHKYVLFSYALNSCHRNHRRYSSCGYHHTESHPGKWRDCEECKELDSAVDPEFEERTCVSCNLVSDSLEDFAFQIEEDFYCKKDECQAKGKKSQTKSTKSKVKVKKESVVEKKKNESTCQVSNNTPKLTKSGRCSGYNSKTANALSLKLITDFYCIKDKCQEKGEQSPSKGTKRKMDVEKESTGSVKKGKKVCRLCGKTKTLTKTECCDSWVCHNSHKKGFLTSCYKNHLGFSCCAFHHKQGHEGKALDCEKCKELGSFQFDFDDFKTTCSNNEQENVEPEND